MVPLHLTFTYGNLMVFVFRSVCRLQLGGQFGMPWGQLWEPWGDLFCALPVILGASKLNLGSFGEPWDLYLEPWPEKLYTPITHSVPGTDKVVVLEPTWSKHLRAGSVGDNDLLTWFLGHLGGPRFVNIIIGSTWRHRFVHRKFREGATSC